ncbi:hypothetical protein AB6A40_006774 [Gnathostoma spinigerum]|uniref:Nucleotide-diphospho-sugar transferase domain-containing protein n=1 Tax=Gnathostoma spinigerum TaxID=75299 RepID=A0ABD6EKI6_9BILA
MSGIRWTQRIVGCLLIYAFIHCIVTIVDYRTVIERTVIPEKRESDGPLIKKDGDPKKGKSGSLKCVNIVRSTGKKPILTKGPRSDKIEMHPPRNLTQKVPKMAESFLKALELAAEELRSKSPDFIYFNLINHAYLNLTLNWLCNLAALSSKLHKKVLIVSFDKQSCVVISKEWPDLKCVPMEVPSEYNRPLLWGHQNYINLLTARAKLMLFLVQLQIPYVLVESDAVWLRDPTDFFINQTLIDDADIIVPTKGYTTNGVYSFDPMIVYPTNGSLYLMEEIERQLTSNPKLFDQDVLESLCRRQYQGVVCRLFEWTNVADGKWFKLSDHQRSGFIPYIINNNYYVGVTDKISRQALNGFWFLTLKNSCSKSKSGNQLKKQLSKLRRKNK